MSSTRRPGQGGQFLGELRLPYERPLASPDLYQLEAFQLLAWPCGPVVRLTPYFPDQLLLRWELGAGASAPGGNRGRQVLLDLEVQRNGTLWVRAHTDT